jgi:Tol biopolymer transport system component
MNVVRLLIVATLLSLASSGTAAAQYGFYYGRNKVQYDSFEWRILRTEHFDIYHYPEMEELARQGATFAEEAYGELQNRFNFSLTNRVPIIFYSSNLHFKQTNTTPGFIPDGVGGFFEFLKGRVVIPANGNLHRFRRVIRHELVHVFTYNKTIRVLRDHRKVADRFLPLWFTEGLAEYWSGEPDHNHEMIMRDAVFSNYLVPLETMYRIYGTFQMYKQGEAVCRFIAERYGEEKILELIEAVWQSKRFNSVMEFVLREDFDSIAREWYAWVKRRYYPALEEIDVPSLIAERIETRGFSAKPTFYQRSDGSRMVYFVGNKTGYTNLYEVPVDEEFSPLDRPRVLIKGERSGKYEAFHLFESRMSVSPGGKLAFVTKSGATDVIHVYDLESRRAIDTYRFENLVAVYSPDWSPEGNRLVFAAIARDGYSDLYAYETTADRLTRLTSDTYDDRDPSWSPDGTRIAFSSDRSSTGRDGFYNLFMIRPDDGTLSYVTYGNRLDLSPRWSPDGDHLVFASSVRDSTGRFGPQDIWTADLTARPDNEIALASSSDDPALLGVESSAFTLRQVTHLSSAAFDPFWTQDDQLIFASFESYRFAIRHLSAFDSLRASPKVVEAVNPADFDAKWEFDQLEASTGVESSTYRKKYQLDLAYGQISQSAVLGTLGGAVVAFSDMLGDDHLYLTVFNTATSQRDFLRSLSFAASRFQLHKRTNISYGLYRYSGRRYDLTDPDAPAEYPVFYETIYGGFGGVSYPISKFRRVELRTSLNFSDKQIGIRGIDRQALLLSNAITLSHDNALYTMDGPVEGWRAAIMAAYTTDIHQSNVSYFTLYGDIRKYFRIGSRITFASRFMAGWNQGREARLFVFGGSWDLRGFGLYSVRGQKVWFMSHELRLPLVAAPSLIVPVLAPFGISNFRTALFFDAAHAWNQDYRRLQPQITAGETLGAAGIGFRLTIFGGFVLRYDLGYRYRRDFNVRQSFRQFFFGWDF